MQKMDQQGLNQQFYLDIEYISNMLTNIYCLTYTMKYLMP